MTPEMICPRCQCTKYYPLAGRKFVRCANCRCDFSETSGTLWASPKMPANRREEIIALLGQGRSALSISKEVGVQYKTVWNIKRKLESNQEVDCSSDVPFQIGDVVMNLNDEGEGVVALVTGFCQNDEFVRVRDDNGRSRIWKKENLWNDSNEVRKQTGEIQ